MRRLAAAVAILWTFHLTGQMTVRAQSPTVYTVKPIDNGRELVGLQVTMRFSADLDGDTVVKLPDEYGGEQKLFQYLSNLNVAGIKWVSGFGTSKLHVNSLPGANLVLSYVLPANSQNSVDSSSRYTFKLFGKDYFKVLGPTLFSTIEGRESEVAHFEWQAPKPWKFASDLNYLTAASTQRDVVQSVLVGGYTLRISTVQTGSSNLKIAMLGNASNAGMTMSEGISSIIRLQAKFWGDGPPEYLITYTALSDGGSQEMGGTNLGNAFDFGATSNVPVADQFITASHEYFHNWIPFKFGAPNKRGLGLWFSEGFSEFYGREFALRSSVITPSEFAASWNEILLNYATSPHKNVAGQFVSEASANDYSVEQLGYSRGAVFAAYLRDKLGKQGINMDDFLRRMQADAEQDPKLFHWPYEDRFEHAAVGLGVSVKSEIEAYVGKGKSIRLVESTFGPCFQVVTLHVPPLDPGYDGNATSASGEFVGVKVDSAAYRAGLRNGMKRLKRLSGSPTDSSIPFSFLIRDLGGRERVITYLPQGSGSIEVQRILPTNDKLCTA